MTRVINLPGCVILHRDYLGFAGGGSNPDDYLGDFSPEKVAGEILSEGVDSNSHSRLRYALHLGYFGGVGTGARTIERG